MNEGFIEAKPCAESAKKTRYYYVAFKGSGFFVRKGDGGYRNWAFYGVFTRGQGTDSNRVTFQARTCLRAGRRRDLDETTRRRA